MVERTLAKKEANLQIEYATASIDVSVKIGVGTKRKFEHMSSDDVDIEMPYLTNTKDIAAHTKLIALDDASCHKLASTS